MGIKGFASWLRQTFPDAFTLISLHRRPAGKTEKQMKFDQVYVDLNPFLHVAARQSASREKVLGSCRRSVRQALTSLARPKHSVCIVMDGAAPIAKLPEQRTRRQEAAISAARRLTFDTQQITPGCLFMAHVEAEMYSLLKDFFSSTRPDESPDFKAVLDGCSVAGEGEFKIFRRLLLDHLDQDFLQKRRMSRAVLAADADSLLQALLCDVPNVHVIDPFANQNGNYCFSVDRLKRALSGQEEKGGCVARLKALDLAIFALMSGSDYAPSLKFANYRTLWPAYLCWQTQAEEHGLFLACPEKKSFSLAALQGFFAYYLDQVFPADLRSRLEAFHAELDVQTRRERILRYFEHLAWNLDALITSHAADHEISLSVDKTAPSLIELATLPLDLQDELDARCAKFCETTHVSGKQSRLPASVALTTLDHSSGGREYVAEPLRHLFDVSGTEGLSDSELIRRCSEAIESIEKSRFNPVEELATFARPPLVLSRQNAKSSVGFFEAVVQAARSGPADRDCLPVSIPWTRPYLYPV